MNTEATVGRSSGRAVSFSTIEARISASCGVSKGSPSARLSQAAASRAACFSCILRNSSGRLSPTFTS